ncbi:hypothetical protein GYA54_00595 [Candidatus Kuenenbacteria bacterium]|nr:hypothetical protein [Candidatus Kuenenbacteria bacterium]
MMKNARPKTPTQNYIDIAEVHDDLVIMKDNTLVAILLVASVNFDLKSGEEQNAIIQGYISFINSLSFPVQIVVQSRKLNIEGYLAKLKIKEKEQTNELLKIQIREYGQYIKQLVELGDIMSKKFYVVVPYNPQEGMKKQGLVTKFFNSFQAVQIVNMRKEKFLKYRQEIDRRVETVQSGLQGMMINSQQLDTQSLIELFYNTYNPDISDQQKMAEVGKLQVE